MSPHALEITTEQREPHLRTPAGGFRGSGATSPLPSADNLQSQLAELDDFLFSHADKLSSLRQRIGQTPEKVWDRPQPPFYPTAGGSGSSLPASVSRLIVDSPYRPDSCAGETFQLQRLREHEEDLRVFMDAHMTNLQNLRSLLNGYNPYEKAPSFAVTVPSVHDGRASVAPTEQDDFTTEEIKSLSQQFSVIVVFSTFTAGLIIAYLQLMSSLLPAPDREVDPSLATHWYMGFGFGFIGLIWNLAIAIVAGADMAACASGKLWKDRDAIRGRFVVFAFAQAVGAGVFGGCIGLLLYPSPSGHIMVGFCMIIFPAALTRAGLDLASTSKEFRIFKEDLKKYLCCCRRR